MAKQASAEKPDLYLFDAQLRGQYPILCGVDEAGRGPLCGPVSVGAVILDPQQPIEGVNDSKKLSEKKREALYDEIITKAVAFEVVLVPPAEIDRINILNATLHGMAQAVAALPIRPDLALIDGNRVPSGLPCAAQCVTKGDAQSACIAAASILAKVTRDRFMQKLDEEYPQYQLAKHKGYPTKLHYELLAQYGVQPFYRKTFLRKRGLV